MLPEVRTFVQRAAAHRFALDGLLDAIPESYWERAAPGDFWSARNHLQHLATVEAALVQDLVSVIDGAAELWLAGSPDAALFHERRAAVMEAVAGLPCDALRGEMAANRALAVATLGALTPDHMEAGLLIAGVVDRWGQPVRYSLREYLAAWPNHDLAHDGAIRAAISTPPDLSAVALTRRHRS
jgi:hypothetical protein